MIDFDSLLSENPFSVSYKEKEEWFCEAQRKLTDFHYDRCVPYRNIIDRLGFSLTADCKLDFIPFIPVRAFKENDLKSIDDTDVARTLTSSGTSGQKVSQIHLDRRSTFLQSRILRHIFSDILPASADITLFVLEKSETLKSKNNISASIAAIRGFSQFAKHVVAIIDDEGNLNFEILKDFVDMNPKQPFILFGLTGAIWFQLLEYAKINCLSLNNNNGIVIHGGGWKKLVSAAVDRSVLNDTIKQRLGINLVHNYYGMVEQTGSVFIECEMGYFHPSIYSEVIIRDSQLSVAGIGEAGLIQVLSLLAHSYPGHSLLTDDIGVIEGVDCCRCGRKGKFFSVLGRAPGVELRGCSDVANS